MNLLEFILHHFEASPDTRLRVSGITYEASKVFIDRTDLSRPKQLVWWAEQHGLVCSVNWQVAEPQPRVLSYRFEKLQPAGAPLPAADSAAPGTPPCAPETIPAAAVSAPPPDVSEPPPSSSPPAPGAFPAGTPHDTPADHPCL